MNVFRFEMKGLKNSLLGWCLAICGLLGIYLWIYPIFQSSDFDIAALYARFPDALQSLFGMANLDTGSMTGYLPFPMKLTQEFVAIGGFILGVRTASHDTREKSADFLYTRPVSRQHILSAKIGAMGASGGILLVVQTVVLWLLTTLFSPGEIGILNLFVSAMVSVLIFWLYGAAGILVGTCFPRIRGTAAVALCSMFFFEIVFSICKILTGSSNGWAVRIFVPVAMFDRELAAAQARLDWPYVLLWVCEVCVLLAFAFRTANRRDIAAE